MISNASLFIGHGSSREWCEYYKQQSRRGVSGGFALNVCRGWDNQKDLHHNILDVIVEPGRYRDAQRDRASIAAL
jgi:hypothetical protein